MKKGITYIIVFLILAFSYGNGGQLFGGRKSKSKSISSSKKFSNSNEQDEPFLEESTPTVTSRKNIESVIPVKRIPQGWIFRGELLAPWEANLPAVLSVIPD